MPLPDDFPDWAAWLSLAVALGVLEVFSLDLVLLMLAAGAVVGMVVDLAGLDLWVQVLAAVAASVAALGFVRPSVVRRLHEGPTLVQGHRALVGRQAVVVERVTWDSGLVRVDGDLWTARPYDETDTIEVGRKVDVFEIKGATALVHPVPELNPPD